MAEAQSVQFGGTVFRYSADSNLVELRDSAWLRTGNVELVADSINYLTEDQLLSGGGSFSLTVEKTRTVGQELRYNVRTGRGWARGARAFVEKGWVEGESVYLVAPNRLNVIRGSFTTCEELPPHYSFRALKMRLIKDDIAVVWPLVFWVRDIPVAAAPFWFFPLKKQRSSGFLSPRVGYHSQDGKYFRNLAYFLALNNYTNITFGLDFLERRGPRFFGEIYLYKYKSFETDVKASWSRDQIQENERWSLDGGHTQELWGAHIGAEAHYLSDLDYRQDYSEDKTEFLKSESHSFLSAYRPFGPLGLTLGLDDRLDLVSGRRDLALPRLSLSLATLSLGPLSVGGSASYAREGHRDSLGRPVRMTEGAGLQASVSSKPLGLWHLRLTPSLAGDLTWRDTLGSWAGGRVGLSAATTLYGLSWFGLGPFTRFLHTFTPSLSVSRSLGTVPISGDVEAQEGETSLSFSVSNSWDAKLRRDTAETTVRLAEAGAALSYSPATDSLSPVSLSFELLPGGRLGPLGFSSRFTGAYDLYSGKMERKSLTTGFGITLGPLPQAQDTLSGQEEARAVNRPTVKPFKLEITHTLADEAHSATLSISGNPSLMWWASYELYYDLTAMKPLSYTVSLTRDLHCWIARISYNRFGTYWTYNLELKIKNLPDITLKRGFFELFLP